MFRIITQSIVILALIGVLFLVGQSLPAQAQSTPALTGFTVTADPRSTTTLDVKWNTVGGVGLFLIQWKSGTQTYSEFTRNFADAINPSATAHQITGLTANTQYSVRVGLYDNSSPRQLLAQSETTATTNATAVEYVPIIYRVTPSPGPEGATFVFNLRLIDGIGLKVVNAPPGGLTVNVTVSDATTGGDFLAPENEGAGTVTFAEGESETTYSVPTVDDNRDEPNGRIELALVAGDGYTVGNSLASQTPMVRDNDEIAGLDLRVFAPDFIEGAGRRSMYVTPILLGTDGKPVKAGSDTVTTLAFAHVETEASDITAWDTGVLVTIKAGKSRRKTRLYVTPADDAVKESPERFRLDGYVTAISSTNPLDSWTGRIVDNDHTPPTGLVLSVSPASVSEGANSTSVTFTLSFGGGGSFGHDSRVTIYHGYDLAKANENCLRRPQSRYGDKEWTCSYADYARDRRASNLPEDSIYAHKDYDFPNSRTITIPAGATSGTAAATFDPKEDDVIEGEERAFFYVEHTFWGAGGELVTLKGGTSIAIADKEEASASSGPQDPPPPVGPGTLTGLSVAPVTGEPTHLAVSWNAVEGASKYNLWWKTGSGGYGDAVETTTNSYTITGLTAGTTYTVNVAALEEDYTLLADAVANGTTSAPTGGASGATGPPAVSFVIYHDPDGGAAAVNRYNQAVTLLTGAGISYRVVSGDVQADASKLAGVASSVMPRFFLGDPTATDWVSETKVNNGGLRWLKGKVAELSGD